MPDILKTLSAMSAEWLTSALNDAGHDVEVTAVDVQAMDGFVGALGEVAIVTPTYGAETDLPDQFVAKCPLDDEIASLYNSVMQNYVREHGFYRDMVDRVDMRTPKAYVNLYDPETDTATLLLDRIAPAEKGDILVGTSFDRLHRLVGDLARMHGQFWMDESLRELPWLMDWSAPSLPLGIEMVQQAWAGLNAAEPDRIPPAVRDAVAGSWVNDTLHWLELYTDQPWTFTHLDYELDNILFDDEGPIILDWQSGMRSQPGTDLAWCLSASHTPETIERESELLDHYRAEFARAGGPQWSAAQLEERLGMGILYNMGGAPVPYLQDVSAYGEHGDRMHRRFDKFLQGCIDSSVRWNMPDHVGPHLRTLS